MEKREVLRIGVVRVCNVRCGWCGGVMAQTSHWVRKQWHTRYQYDSERAREQIAIF